MPAHNFNWLKTLTMSVPFAGRGKINLPEDVGISAPILSEDPRMRHRDYGVATRIRVIFDAIHHAPHLMELNLVIEPDWQYVGRLAQEWYDSLTRWPHVESYKDNCERLSYFIDNEAIWDDFMNLLAAKRSLQVSIIRVISEGHGKDVLRGSQRAFVREMRSRGIWDVRVARVLTKDIASGCLVWDMPALSIEENTKESLTSPRNLRQTSNN